VVMAALALAIPLIGKGVRRGDHGRIGKPNCPHADPVPAGERLAVVLELHEPQC
jgi:hypothetical protein